VFDLRRLGGILLAAAFVALCLAIAELGLSSTAPAWPVRLRNDWEPRHYEFLKVAGSVLSLHLVERTNSHRPLGLMIGSSSTGQIDPREMEQFSANQVRWLILHGPNGSPIEMKFALQSALRSGLRPKRIVLGLELSQFARWTPFHHFLYADASGFHPGSRVQKLVSEVRHGQPNALSSLEDLAGYVVSFGFNRCFPERTRIQQRLYSRLLYLRIAFLDLVGQDFTAVFVPKAQPLDNGPLVPLAEGNPEAVPPVAFEPKAKKKFDVDPKSKSFAPENYAIESETYRGLVDVVRLAQSTGAEVSIVIIPLPTEMRKNIPPIARQNVDRVLRESFGTAVPATIDLYEFLPDDQFHDRTHANQIGRSRLAAEIVRQLRS
jgi:hypothetical protein